MSPSINLSKNVSSAPVIKKVRNIDSNNMIAIKINNNQELIIVSPTYFHIYYKLVD